MSVKFIGDESGRSSFGFAKGEMVHIYVGPQKERFMVHKHILLEASGRISDAFEEEDSKERETGMIQMPGEDPHAFTFFVDWLYQARKKRFKAVSWTDPHPPLSIYLKLWMLGHRWIIPELQNNVMRQLHAWRMEDAKKHFEELHAALIKERRILSGVELDTENNILAEWIIDMYSLKCGYDVELKECGLDAFDPNFLLQLANNNVSIRGRDKLIDDFTDDVEYFLVNE